MAPHRILFVTRQAIVHQLGGSTTYAVNLLDLLAAHGAEITVLTTAAQSRSPRLFFTARVPLPDGAHLIAPGTWRIGSLYLNLFSAHAWARAIMRFAARWQPAHALAAALERHFGDRLTDVAWDLSEPTAAERAVLLRYAALTNATTIIGNYAYFGSVFDAPALRALRRVLLLHDLLADRVARFRAAGLPLDCTPVEPAQERRWLANATCALAAQPREAELLQSVTPINIVVPPMVWSAHPPSRSVMPGRLLFVGSNIAPNQTGLAWFLAEVWPLILAQVPTAALAVAGTVGQFVEAPPPGVLVLGQVPSLDAEYARAAVVIVPLLVGTGIKIKLVEALSFGKAVVSTSVGVQGVETLAPNVIDVADDPARFAAHAIALLSNPQLRKQREAAAFALTQTHFSAEQQLPRDFAECVLGSDS